jgi:hypothetical protein
MQLVSLMEWQEIAELKCNEKKVIGNEMGEIV